MWTATSVARAALILLVGSLLSASACSDSSGNGDENGGGRDPGDGRAGESAAFSGAAGQQPNGSAGSKSGDGNHGGAGTGESGAPSGAGSPDGAGGAGALAAVSGIVAAFRPNPADLEERVSGALVTLDDGEQQYTAVSDDDGLFAFDAVPPGHYRSSVTVSAEARKSHDGAPYGDWFGEVDVVADQTARLMPLLNLGCFISGSVGADKETFFNSNGIGSMGCGAYDLFGQLRIPSGGLVKANGDAFTGTARLELNPIWFPMLGGEPNMKGLLAMPPLAGVPQGETEPEPIHTFAAADIRVYDAASDEKLSLKEGTLAELTLRGWRALTEDDAYTSWSFDPTTGAWHEDGGCVADVSDPQLVHCDVRHFSWWNADRPSSGGGSGIAVSRGCVVGGVRYQGKALAGAEVIAVGSDGIAGLGRDETDLAGSFCAEGLTSTGKWGVQIRYANGREILLETISVQQEKLPASCQEPMKCAQAGYLEIRSTPSITVRGKLGLDVKGEHQPMPKGGFIFGTRVRVIGSPDPFGQIQLNLGVVRLASDGSYQFGIPESVVRLFFVSPQDGECKTYPGMVPGEGDPVDMADQFFICGS